MIYLIEHDEEEAVVIPLFCTCSRCGCKVLTLAINEKLRDPDV